ncbi:glycosyl hydrolase 108 family protein [Sulfurimonas sp.]|jgi:lysozyme family protein|uniref:glycoside hydrolase family 108 protein n=1 Tax=Sulfurimonas sp. TaxID=2022749 RepID=UPI002A3697DD|nr:glycosyl hydrolase 108 family protein [Sulfurimonas sp.]MDY0124499.1 glycosyl hydrolase 108 family protein [Sulfurimonas sp.]
MANFNNSIDKVLVSEGGYVNDPNDRGGETKFGISKRAYPHIDIKNLTTDEAKAIYKQDYWDSIKGDEINSDLVAYEIFDTAVNMGSRTASKLAQVIIGSHPDGIIGVQSLAKLNEINEELFLVKYKLAKIARYAYLVKIRPENKKFLFGWINRVLGA